MADLGISTDWVRIDVVDILGLGIVLMILKIYSIFCSEIRELNTYCKYCMLATIKVYACYAVRLYKKQPKKNS